MQDFRRLEVWQLAHEATLAIYRFAAGFPSDERFGISSQLRRASVSIEANLAEGCGRGTDADFARFVQTAMGSASETECHLLIARDLGFLDEPAHRRLEEKLQRVKRMLASRLKTLKAS
jgi:four helix bundle protein